MPTQTASTVNVTPTHDESTVAIDPERTDKPPWCPPGTVVDLSGDRSLFVRDSGATSKPIIVLLHGWMATADLNFGFQYAQLVQHFRVIAFDQRGHGRGLKTSGRFSLARCADDVPDVLDALGIDRAIIVGYSMGGPIALHVAHRHPARTSGLVLCATSGRFSRSPLTRSLLAPAGALVGLTGRIPDSSIRRYARSRIINRRASGPYTDWITRQLEPSDPSALAMAGIALGRFDAYRWCGDIDTTIVSVITVDDQLVDPARQHALARTVRAKSSFEVTGGHTTCFDHPQVFTPVLTDACHSVVA